MRGIQGHIVHNLMDYPYLIFSIFQIRFYSASNKVSKDSLDFLRKVNSFKLDENNPFFIVNRFLFFLHGKKQNINLINSILKRYILDFEFTLPYFNILKGIKPVRFELPVDNTFTELVGKYTRGSEVGKASFGRVYKFINKFNGQSHIGSFVSLAIRLTTGYFGPNLGNRVIDLSIKEAGLDKFYMYSY
nr:hypothetical protein [Valsa mali var. pyri (nom. inval.)]